MRPPDKRLIRVIMAQRNWLLHKNVFTKMMNKTRSYQHVRRCNEGIVAAAARWVTCMRLLSRIDFFFQMFSVQATKIGQMMSWVDTWLYVGLEPRQLLHKQQYVTILCEEDVIQMLRRKFFSVSICFFRIYFAFRFSAHSNQHTHTTKHDVDLNFANREKLTRIACSGHRPSALS